MKTYYVAHPFTGNEEKNRKEVSGFTQMLSEDYPDRVFLSPINALAPLEDMLDYEIILNHGLELLSRCDGLLLTGEWQKSYGCQKELELAEKTNKDIFKGLDEFYTLLPAQKKDKEAKLKAYCFTNYQVSPIVVYAENRKAAIEQLSQRFKAYKLSSKKRREQEFDNLFSQKVIRIPWADALQGSSVEDIQFRTEALKHGWVVTCSSCGTILTKDDFSGNSQDTAQIIDGKFYCPACVYDLKKNLQK